MDIEEQSLLEHFEDCFQFKAKQENERILVHCIVGKSCSTVVVIAYLMYSRRMILKEAFSHVKGKRELIQPNEG